MTKQRKQYLAATLVCTTNAARDWIDQKSVTIAENGVVHYELKITLTSKELEIISYSM